MANSINATSTGNGGIITTGDDSGVLNIQTNETTAMSVDASQSVDFVNNIDAPNTFGFKNRLINGGFVVSQYNGSSSFTATTGGLRYGIDRFFMYCTGANLTGQQVSGTNTGTYKAWRITGATGSTGLNFAQRIESLNTSDLASQSVTVSAKVYCSTAVTGAAVYALVPTAQDNYTSTTTSFSTAITLSAGLNTISVTGTIGSTGANGIEIGIGFGSGVGNGVTVEVGSFQVEKGTQATSFDYRPYGTELALCQRYFEKSVDQTTAIQTSAVATYYGAIPASIATGIWYMTVPFKVTKRTAPTVTTYPYTTTTNTNRFSNNVGSDYGANSALAGGVYDTQFSIQNNSGSTLTVGSGIVFGSWFASAEL